jgi:hypothetical protein
LADAELVKREKSGQKVFYSLNGDALGAVCIGLAASFPCCCVTVTTNPTGTTDQDENKRKKGGHR